MNIATLPTNMDDYQSESPKTLKTLKNLNIADYSAKSFVVFGKDTKKYKDHLKGFEGKYNGKLKPKPGFPGGPGWIIRMYLKPQVSDFINKVNNQQQTNDYPTEAQQTDGISLPSFISPPTQSSSVYQTVRWKVFKPSAGMEVTIKANGASSKYMVSQVESHKDIIDTAWIQANNGSSKLVICNGKWQVLGYMVDHTVFFKKDTINATVNTVNTTDLANI